MRCAHCDTNTVQMHMTVTNGHTVTLRSCGCTRRWFKDGHPVGLADVVASVPRRRPRAQRRTAQAA